jgi:hypothetical protein
MINTQLERIKNDLINMQRWADSLKPDVKAHPQMTHFINSAFQARMAIESLQAEECKRKRTGP